MVLVVSSKYIAYCYGNTIIVRDTTAFNQVCAITESLDIYDIKVTDKNLFVSLPDSTKQYDVTNCVNIGSYSTGAQLLATVEASTGYPYDQLFLWNYEQTSVAKLTVTNWEKKMEGEKPIDLFGKLFNLIFVFEKYIFLFLL